jgi:hypothetical protein
MEEVEAAARVLHEAGLRYRRRKLGRKSYDELAATDAVGKDEFDAIVERMLMAAHAAGEEGQR